ncbi:MAG: transglycosylase SLT domain-containing protein [Candidatus Sulfotelmatobacter sp.]
MQLAKVYVRDNGRDYLRAVGLALVILAGSACQTAQKPAALLPPTTAPALQPAATAPGPLPGTAPAAAQTAPASQQDAQPVQPGSAQKPAEASSTASPASDPVADLIAKVEKEYQTGLANYHAGKTEDAKQDFDNALNALLGSNFDVRSDDRLQKEFDRVVQGVDELYPGGTAADSETAQQQPQQKSEPAPIDETNGVTPAADARVKAKAEAEIKNTNSDLPLMMTDQVAGYISYFSGYGRGVFERAYARSGRYHDMIVATLKEEGVPQDLIYLAQAESGFHPLAVSRAGARGIWQFMSSRARGYGLHHNMWVDDRQDPEKSTRAAARHLKELYQQFGDWYLAMAAYNSGPGTVQSAVKRTGYADFWELYHRNVLPHETRNYVPIILAVTIMTKNPSQYGLDAVVMEKPPAYETVRLDYPVDLRLVAQCINSTTAELQDLNPSLLRLSTPREGRFDLRLPVGTKDQYETAIAAIPADKRLWWRFHTVRSGDTLVALAHNYRVTARSIKEVNHLDSNELEADARLVIPMAAGTRALSDGATYARHITWYHVHKGDTVESVADNFGVSPQMIRRWNGVRGSSLSGRKVVALHVPITPHDSEVASSRKPKHPPAGPSTTSPKTDTAGVKPPATKSAEIEKLDTAKAEPSVVHHKVKSGETLYSIAQAYKTTVAALKRDNRNVAVLHPGMILIVQAAR